MVRAKLTVGPQPNPPDLVVWDAGDARARQAELVASYAEGPLSDAELVEMDELEAEAARGEHDYERHMRLSALQIRHSEELHRIRVDGAIREIADGSEFTDGYGAVIARLAEEADAKRRIKLERVDRTVAAAMAADRARGFAWRARVDAGTITPGRRACGSSRRKSRSTVPRRRARGTPAREPDPPPRDLAALRGRG